RPRRPGKTWACRSFSPWGRQDNKGNRGQSPISIPPDSRLANLVAQPRLLDGLWRVVRACRLAVHVLELDQRVVRPAAVAQRQEVSAIEQHLAVSVGKLFPGYLAAAQARIESLD